MVSCAAAAPRATVQLAPAVAKQVAPVVIEKPEKVVTHRETITIRNASRRYDFVIHTGAPAKVDVDDKSGTTLQTITLDEIAIQRDDSGAIVVDSGEIYDAQGTINVGDFDFDGREDFAIQIDQNGPYGGPTFDVWLQTSNDSFARSEELSELTRTTLGFFQIDPDRRLLITMAKSGCCWHETEEHEVRGGKPVAVHRVTEDAMTDDAWVITTEEALVKGRWVTHVTRSPK